MNLAQIAYNECERPLQAESADRDGENSSGSEVEETLTWDALKIVLSVLAADTEDPWSDPPSFKVCACAVCSFFAVSYVACGFVLHYYRVLKQHPHSHKIDLYRSTFNVPYVQAAWRHDEGVEQRILLRGLSHIGATLTFDDWIAHWSLLALNEPAVTQVRFCRHLCF